MSISKLYKGHSTEFVRLYLKLYDKWINGFRTDKETLREIIRLSACCHVRFMWCGNFSPSQGDKFIIIRNGMEYYFAVDSVRYDGINGKSYYESISF